MHKSDAIKDAFEHTFSDITMKEKWNNKECRCYGKFASIDDTYKISSTSVKLYVYGKI